MEGAGSAPGKIVGIALKIWLLAALAGSACATTLMQLSMASMIAESTSVVRARVIGASAARRGSDIYTYFRLDVVETLKGTAPGEVAVPGGTLAGARQIVAGAPKLENGQEYVLFLWTSRSGLTQVTGLTQGVFRVVRNASGEITVVRSASTEPMLDASGRPVKDETLTLTLEALRAAVRGGMQ
jgi:hypothetical protein